MTICLSGARRLQLLGGEVGGILFINLFALGHEKGPLGQVWATLFTAINNLQNLSGRAAFAAILFTPGRRCLHKGTIIQQESFSVSTETPLLKSMAFGNPWLSLIDPGMTFLRIRYTEQCIERRVHVHP